MSMPSGSTAVNGQSLPSPTTSTSSTLASTIPASVDGGPASAADTSAPVHGAPAPVDGVSAPVNGTPGPENSTSAPDNDTYTFSNGNSAPANNTLAPANNAAAPVAVASTSAAGTANHAPVSHTDTHPANPLPTRRLLSETVTVFERSVLTSYAQICHRCHCSCRRPSWVHSGRRHQRRVRRSRRDERVCV